MIVSLTNLALLPVKSMVDLVFLGLFVYAILLWVVVGVSIASYREGERKFGLFCAVLAGVGFGQLISAVALTLFMEGWHW